MDGDKNLNNMTLKLMDGMINKYSITDEEMGRILGLGAGQADAVEDLRKNPSKVSEPMKKRIKFLFEVFLSLKTHYGDDVPKITEALRGQKNFSRAGQTTKEYTLFDLMCDAEDDASYAVKKYLLVLTGGVWSGDYGPNDTNIQ